ncbi:MAG: thiamine-phosphate kinase [Acidobacteria bacterium]|nr:thiamine-phosphate kinase [Acidobacteriota bacterium]
MTVGELGELGLIARIKARLPESAPGILVGPGDDAAVMERCRGEELAITTDALVDGVHFDRSFVPLDAVGYRALAVNLSDLAAMGARPLTCVLSLGLPARTELAAIDRFLDGFLALASQFGVTLAGGNISNSPNVLFVDVTAIGSVRRRRILARRGARPGDDLWVSGEIGAAAAGLEWLRERRDSGFGRLRSHDQTERTSASLAEARSAEAGVRDSEEEAEFSRCIERFLRPEPRVRLGRALASHRAASSCIDLSDGLGDAVRQLCAASGVGAALEADALPIAPPARRWFESHGQPAIDRAIAGGDDYELLFTSAPRVRRRLDAVARLGRVRLTRVGSITADRRVVLQYGGREEELPPGFAHFR